AAAGGHDDRAIVDRRGVGLRGLRRLRRFVRGEGGRRKCDCRNASESGQRGPPRERVPQVILPWPQGASLTPFPRCQS
ncbi:hypothetical protein, partial [Novosphingobium huizhouense]|uniref:hypothetical protein n=1 Tax=Novosphingobium huizhouense TaxID=2866625 RepID=UPI001CD84696